MHQTCSSKGPGLSWGAGGHGHWRGLCWTPSPGCGRILRDGPGLQAVGTQSPCWEASVAHSPALPLTFQGAGVLAGPGGLDITVPLVLQMGR